MGWSNVDDKHKKGIDKLYVSCEEKYEIDYIVKIVREEYSWLSETTIRQAIASCCASIKAPRKREDFMACLKNKLGVS
jgi:hypothetical protein